MTPAPDRRRGFTLVELLVVVALIAALAALTAGAVARVQASQKTQATEATITKLNVALDRKWAAVIDNAKDPRRAGDIHPAVLAYADYDRDRALAIWIYANLKVEFPTRIEEARGDLCPNAAQGAPATDRGVWLWSPATMPQAILVLRSRAVFNQLQPGGSDAEQSAACAYASLSWTNTRGEESAGEGLQNQVADLANGNRVFKDAWGQPIAFLRQAYTPEVNGPPYTQVPALRDIADPQGKLVNFTGGWTPQKLNDLWLRIMDSHADYGKPATYPGLGPPPQPWNWVPTFISGGPNKQIDGWFNEDNSVGFRLRREGNRSN